MNRREVLAGSGVALAAVASGCTGVLQGGGEQEPTDDKTDDADETDEAGETEDPRRETAAENTFDGEQGAVVRVLRQNIRATEEQRLQSLRETLHPESPIYDRTIQQTRQLWDQYDLVYSLTVRSVTVTGGEATAEYEQVTRATGPNSDKFRDNRIVVTGSFRTYQGEWRIYSSQIDDIEYLE